MAEMEDYCEIAPPARLAQAIECFWSMQVGGTGTTHRVTPDGCADILVRRSGGGVSIDVVGPMTRYVDHRLPPGQALFGVRFHPGMWTGCLGVPGDRLTDELVPLDDLWGRRARDLLDQLAGESSPLQCASRFAALLAPPSAANPVQKALASMARLRGCVSVDQLAGQAGLSARQFRRLCLEQAGLTPKFLAQVLRFRHAQSRAGAHPGGFAGLALDCGYYDQAHLINEFRRFSGRTPAGFLVAL